MIYEEIDELLTEAYDHLESGRHRMALTAAQKAYNQQPENYKALVCLAWATLENGNPNGALEFINRSILLGGDEVTTRLYRGYLLTRMGIYDGAATDLDFVLSKEPGAWAYLNKARALGGQNKFKEALIFIEKAVESEQDDKAKLLKIKEWIKKAIGEEEGILGIFPRKKNILKDAEEAFKEKEYWFSIWAARQVLKTSSMANERKRAHYIELETLFAQFQFNAAKEKAEDVKYQLRDDDKFKALYQKLSKYGTSSFQSEVDKIDAQLPVRTDFEKFDDELYNVVQAKTFDFIEHLRAGRKTYLLQFNESSIRFIGVEVQFENPFYELNRVDVEGKAEWFVNGKRVGVHSFILTVEEKWKVVEFTQSWGSDNAGFWGKGQGRVDIYLDNKKACTRWFIIGDAEVVNFEEHKNRFQVINEFDQSHKHQPTDVRETALIPSSHETLDDLLKELNTYTGLEDVKTSMFDFITYLKFLHERKRHGLKSADNLTIHCTFMGNPGTGKTSIARLVGKIFKAMGLLQNGHVIEVDRSNLVGQYIGETAQKTDKVIEEAIGGVLFIDEAYNLKKQGSQQDFGQEAIDVLLKRMEDKKGEFVVIAAGYPDEMKSFINSNPGLKSRFTHFFNFQDFTPEELLKIFEDSAVKEDYIVVDDAKELLKKEFTNLYRNRDQSFGNARVVRNIFSEAKMYLSKRIIKLSEPERTKEKMTAITAEDIQAALSGSSIKELRFGIDEEDLKNSLLKLNNLIGLSSVKKEINELVKITRFNIEEGKQSENNFAQHFVFVGNPGTGKTTVARLFSEIFSALGVLPKGHLIETDRQGMVGSYIGQTAEKTKDQIDRAIGGTLFIDEAYSLLKKGDNNSSDFGREAIDTLLKRMEDDRGKFICIAAGYTNEMNDFLESNPGLKSRFTQKIIFDDYSPDELMLITQNYFKEKGHELHEEAAEQLKKYYNKQYRSRDKSFGNARLVRNLIEAALKNHLLRIADIPAEDRNEEIIRIVTYDDIKEIVQSKKEKAAVKIEGDPELLDNYLNELHELTGLDSVKKSVDKLISSLKVAKLREQRGLKVIPKNLHSVFLGNPGTGKTTVARLMSKIYKELGVLERGHLVEVDRSALVAGYQEQTAAKTESIIEKAMGGTLFIDEAYTLSRQGRDFGQEAIDTIIKRMEDHQGKFVVIVAGYPAEMKDFIESNPGLQSRFTNNFTFDDYTPRQMLAIAYIISQKNGYMVDEGAWQLLLEIFTNLYNKRDMSFGNARTVRNILYKAISYQEERILTLIDPSDEELSTITFDDVDKINLQEL